MSIVVVSFGYFLAGGAATYGVTYDNTTLNSYDSLSRLNNISGDINETISTFNPSNPVDIIGGFLTGGFSVLKTSWQSFGVFTDMTTDASNKIGTAVGGGFSYITAGLIMIAFIVFIFIIVSVFVGKDV